MSRDIINNVKGDLAVMQRVLFVKNIGSNVEVF